MAEVPGASALAECVERLCEWDRYCEQLDTAEMLELLHACHRHPEAVKLRKAAAGDFAFDPERFLRENKDVFEHYRRLL